MTCFIVFATLSFFERKDKSHIIAIDFNHSLLITTVSSAIMKIKLSLQDI